MKAQVFSEVLYQISKVIEESYGTKDWREIEIFENGESLVEIPSKLCFPYYSNVMKMTNEKRIFIRKTVLQMLLIANDFVGQRGKQIIVYDGWRSIDTQENLYWHYMKEFTAEKFGLKDVFYGDSVTIKGIFERLPVDVKNRLEKKNREFVSLPSADLLRPSPHSTGGCLDVWLCSLDGNSLDLGVPFDCMEEPAGSFYHLRKKRLRFKNDDLVCSNRELLLEAMIFAGFSCYPYEIWHFNFGNQMDALIRGEVARYSYVCP